MIFKYLNPNMIKTIHTKYYISIFQSSSSNHSELNKDYYDSTKKINKLAHSTPQVLYTSQVLHESTPKNID